MKIVDERSQKATEHPSIELMPNGGVSIYPFLDADAEVPPHYHEPFCWSVFAYQPNFDAGQLLRPALSDEGVVGYLQGEEVVQYKAALDYAVSLLNLELLLDETIPLPSPGGAP